MTFTNFLRTMATYLFSNVIISGRLSNCFFIGILRVVKYLLPRYGGQWRSSKEISISAAKHSAETMALSL